MFINVVISSLVLVFSLVEIHSQVCLTQVFVTKLVEETFTYGHPVIANGHNMLPRYRYKVDTIKKYVPKRVAKNVKRCCAGYKTDDDDMDVSETSCKPVCPLNCTNGYCKYPGICMCNSGYIKNNSKCTPLCNGKLEGCGHGTCVAPDTCECNYGYKLVNETCQQVCTQPCHNGTCVSPETCECLPGYRKSDNDVCEPYCSHDCYHGYCEAPESCGCNTGFRLAKNESHWVYNSCVPVCEIPCGNGTCEYPNTCSCDFGYYASYKRQLGYEYGMVCKPICFNCGGTCVAPYNCVEENSTSTYEYTTRTTTVRHPFRTTSTYKYHNETENNNTFEQHFEGNYSLKSTDDDHANSNVTIGESMVKSWIQQHGMSILIPIIVVVTAGIIMLLIWRWTPMIVINFFRRRRYNVRDASNKNVINVQLLPNDREAQK